MSPFQHGEVFVTDDGAETDLDLGHYEPLSRPLPTTQNQHHHHRPHHTTRDPERAPRRLPGQDRAGDPTHG